MAETTEMTTESDDFSVKTKGRKRKGEREVDMDSSEMETEPKRPNLPAISSDKLMVIYCSATSRNVFPFPCVYLVQ